MSSKTEKDYNPFQPWVKELVSGYVEEDGRNPFEKLCEPEPEPIPLWQLCTMCEDFWCVQHEEHVGDCSCPSIEEFGFDPYYEGGEDYAKDEQEGQE